MPETEAIVLRRGAISTSTQGRDAFYQGRSGDRTAESPEEPIVS
jgi:hypothetical protein